MESLLCAIVLFFQEFGWRNVRPHLKTTLQKVINTFRCVVWIRCGFNHFNVLLIYIAYFLGNLPLEFNWGVHDTPFIYRLVNVLMNYPWRLELLTFRATKTIRSHDLFARNHHGSNIHLFYTLPGSQSLANVLLDTLDLSLCALRPFNAAYWSWIGLVLVSWLFFPCSISGICLPCIV